MIGSAEQCARLTARTLLDIQAVLFRPEDPFTFTSGRRSPVYVDCRRIISFPRARQLLMDLAVGQLAQAVGPEAFDAVAGGETAGIPFAAWMRSEEHTSELQSRPHLVCRLLL